MKLPDFLIVGAAKSGTSSLYHYLKQHPDIYLPTLKEPTFFVSSLYKKLNTDDPKYQSIKNDVIFTFEDYIELYKNAKNGQVLGDASVLYLYFYKKAILEIRKYLGDVKIIIILRNPVDRAFSAYKALYKDGCELISFEESLKIEKKRMEEHYNPMYFYKDQGFYFKQVEVYLRNFNEVKVYLYEDFLKYPKELVKNIYDFLGIDPSFYPDINLKYNEPYFFKSLFLHKLLTKKMFLKTMIKQILPQKTKEKLVYYFKAKNKKEMKMHPETREYLKNLYKEDILRLQNLVNMDLSEWYE